MSSTTRRLFAAAGTTALLATLTPPPAGAEPDNGPYLDQVVTIAGFDLEAGEDSEDGVSGDGGPATAARLGRRMVTIDVGPDGTVYTADASTNRLRMIDKSGVITAVPGTALPPTDENREFAPVAVATSADGVVHVAGQELVYRLVNGAASVLAGGGELTYEDGGTGGDGGPGTSADLGAPADIDVDAAGNVYVADDYRERIRKIDPNGIITTVAGGGTAAAADGGPATGAALGGVQSLAVDSTGAIYFTEQDEPVVRKVAPDGTLSTVSGQGNQLASNTPRLAVDERDIVYVLDGTAVRTIEQDGTLSPVGPPIRASLQDIAVGPDGNVYLAADHKILMLVRNGKPAPAALPTKAGPPPGWAGQEPGTVVTLAGNGKSAPLSTPQSAFDPNARSVAVGADGPTYVADTANHRVLAVDREGRRTVFAGTGKEGSAGNGGPATKAQLTEPRALAAGADGTVYIAETDRIRQVAPDGTISDRAMVAANDIAVDGAGVLYATITHTVVRIDPAGTTTAVGGGGESLPSADSDGRPAAEVALRQLGAVAVDANGIVYFVDTRLAAIFAIDRDGALRTVIGSAEFSASQGGFSGDGGAASAGEVNNVGDLAAGQDGSLYLTDTFNNRIRRIDPAGTVTTVAGTGAGGDTGDGGPAAKASFTEPRGLAVDADGRITVTNRRTDQLRRIDPDGTVSSVTGLDGPAGPRTGSATKAVLGTTDGGSLNVAATPDDTLYVTGFMHTRTVGDGRIAELRPPFTALDGQSIVAGPDGTLYGDSFGALTRWFPNGAATILVSRDHLDTPVKDGSSALHTSLQVRQFAVGPRGELYVSGSHTIFQVRDGKLHRVAGTGAAPGDPINDLAVGPDGTLYASAGARVLKIDDAGAVTTFAGSDSYSAEDNGDGGPADEASLSSAYSIAVSPAGIVYIEASDGVRAVDQDGEINTIVPAEEDSSDIAVDRHGNLLYTTDTQVKAVVRADEVDLSSFGWSALLWGAAAVVVLGLGGWWVLRRRAATTTEPAVHSGTAEDLPSKTEPDDANEPS